MEIKIAKSLDCIDEVVEIHLTTFKGFFLTFLGREFLKLLYSGFIQHENSNIIIAIEEKEIVGFLAYSEDMSSFYKYLIKSKLFNFAWCALKAFVRKPSIILRLLSAFGKSEEVKRKEEYIELASIGVKPDKKGKYIGTEMIDYLKNNIDFEKFSYITLETDAEKNEYVNEFYLKNGFTLVQTYITSQGRKMNEYQYSKNKYKKNVVLVSCFEFYDERMKFIEAFYLNQKYNFKILLSDFNHVKKETETLYKENIELVKTIQYKRNLSLKRIISHVNFSIKIYKKIKNEQVDIVYIMFPPNILSYLMGKLKKSRNFMIINDVIDLWPESFPNELIEKYGCFFYYLWKKMRTIALKDSNLVITECDLYQDILKINNNIIFKTVYLSGGKAKGTLQCKLANDVFNIVYVGQINNLIDIEQIVIIFEIMSRIRKINFYIVGRGDNVCALQNSVESYCNKIHYYGAVYSKEKLSNILSDCHFGLNIMKPNVKVGLTRKSLNYLSNGVPLLNNIRKDTWDLVEKEKIGINFDIDRIQEFIDKLNEYDFTDRENIINVFNKLFEESAIQNRFDSVLSLVEKNHIGFFKNK